MSVVSNSTTQQAVTNNQSTVQPAATATPPIRTHWDATATHATIDSTCDKVGTFIIEAGNLAGGPVAVASLNQGVECSKNLAASNLPDVAPFVNTVLDVVKVPLSVAAQRSGPAIAEASVMMVMPVSRKLAHGSADLAEKSAGCSKNWCS